MKQTRRFFLTTAAATLVLASVAWAVWGGPGATAVSRPSASTGTSESATDRERTHPNGGEKVLYLTFDDGPGEQTVEILDLLDQYDAKATFFALGQNLAPRTSLGRRIIAEGHGLANHTWSHADLTRLDASGRERELERTAELLGRLGSDNTCMRPPYGATDAAVADDVAAHGMRQVLWNVDTEDWTRPGVEAIVSRLLHAESGQVVLMHDGGGDRTQTVEALRRALPDLADAGFTFDIVPDC